MLLSFVCVKIQWIVCCRWIRAPAEACFTVSKKHDKLDFTALVWKRTSSSYNISSFWICSIKVDKCLRTYYKLSRKYLNMAKIISKVTITPQAPQAQNTWCMRQLMCIVYRELYGKITDRKKNCVNNYLNWNKVFLPQMCRELVSCTDFKAILTPFSEVIWNSTLLEGGVTVSNNFTKRHQNGFKIGTRDKFATHLR